MPVDDVPRAIRERWDWSQLMEAEARDRSDSQTGRVSYRLRDAGSQ